MATTATQTNLLEAQPRTAGNKNDARRVRRSGKIPGVVYGAGKSALSVSLDPRQVSRILHSATGHNTIFDLALDGERSKAMIVDWQYERSEERRVGKECISKKRGMRVVIKTQR